MVRTYLEWLIELPWAADPEAPIDIAEARRILDDDHYGLEKIKRRILEYLAVRKLNPAGKSPILCFVGPPGVGKTSLGQSIARATGRKFVAREPGRRPRRGRDPRPPAHVHRLAARQHHPEPAQGRNAQLRDDARRGRQARRGRLPRRSVVGAARGARSRAELDVPRQLPRGAVRPVARDVHLHGERARHDSGAAARPDGNHPAARLHGAGKAADRAPLPRAAPARSHRTQGRAVRDRRRCAAGDHRRLHARSGRAQPRARDRQRVPPRRRAHRRGQRRKDGDRPGRPACDPRRAEVRSRSRDAQRDPRRRDRTCVDARRRRHPVRRGGAHARQRQADPDRPARRRDEGKRAGGAVAGQGARAAARHRAGSARESRTSTSTFRRARRPRTVRARASRCSSR